MESAVLKYAMREAELLKLQGANEQLQVLNWNTVFWWNNLKYRNPQATVSKQQKDIDALNFALRGHKNEKYAQEKVVGEKVAFRWFFCGILSNIRRIYVAYIPQTTVVNIFFG